MLFSLDICKLNISVIVVSPALGDSVKDLRSVHSGLFSDFQQVFRHVLDENARLAEALQGSEMRIAELEDNCMKLDQTLRHLNEVITFHVEITF